MKRESLLFLGLLLLPVSLTAQIIETSGTVSVMGGEYTVMNNVWGATTAQRLEVDLNGSYFKVILSEHNNPGGSVAAYPAIYKGCHWGSCTAAIDNPMPKRIEEIESAPFTWVIGTAGVSGTWNSAFEAWFNETGTGTNFTGELMIWINYAGGAGPAGSKVATVEIGGHTWDVYFAPWDSWNYIAYKLTNVADSVNLDLKDFMHDALTRGYLRTPWYLVSMEAGFEIWRGGQGLTTFSYSASVTEGTSTENYSPTPFSLISPSNNRNLTSMVIPFKWQASVDPNLDPVEYIFHLSGQNVDTTIAQVFEDSLLFNGTNYLQSYTIYSWYVEATDGIDTIPSTTQRTFRTPNVTGMNAPEEIPGRFLLGQNYPNPFNPTTVIRYQLPVSSQVTLKVYDVLGREMEPLVNERHDAGNFSATLNAGNLPSGVYYYRLSVEPLAPPTPTSAERGERDLVSRRGDGQTEGFVDTKKMVLIR
jgi:hypothetical protein